MGMGIREWNNEARNMRLDRSVLSLQDLERALTVWLVVETRTKMWPTLNEFEMPELPRYARAEGIQGLREIGMLQWLYHKKSAHPPWEGAEDTLPPQVWGKIFVKGASGVREELWGCSSLPVRDCSGSCCH